MSEPIKVTRKQWDAAFKLYCAEIEGTTRQHQKDALREFARILGPRPAPEPPHALYIDGKTAMRFVRGKFDHGIDWAVEADLGQWDYLTPEDVQRVHGWLTEVLEAQGGGVR